MTFAQRAINLQKQYKGSQLDSELLKLYDEQNSSENKYASGGFLNSVNGMNINKNLVSFDSGGRHQDNKNGGIMQGTGANGKPNLVEQGETKHENFIYSDRLKVDKDISKQFNLPAGVVGKTFAQASKFLSREGKDRPNDPISNNAIKAHLSMLADAQEHAKAIKQAKEQASQPQQIQQENPQFNMMAQGYAFGGPNFEQSTPQEYQNLRGINFAFGGNQTHYTNTPPQDYKVPISGDGVAASNASSLGVIGYANGGNMSPYPKNINIGYYADGGELDQTHYSNRLPQGYNVYAEGTSELKREDWDLFSKLLEENDTKSQNNYVQPNNNDGDINYTQQLLNLLEKPSQNAGKFIGDKMSRFGKSDFVKNISNPRYAPVFANIGAGLSDIMQNPEIVNYDRITPEKLTSRMNYQPIDTEWMANKINSQIAGARRDVSDASGGNRAAAISGLLGLNKQAIEGLGEAYIKAADTNYNRRNQALGFNANIEAQNVAAANAAKQYNAQIAMQEYEANARNRAAKRMAARNALLNAASNLGDIGKENYFGNIAKSTTGYSADQKGFVEYFNNKE